MGELDDVIHQPVRLKIMAALMALPRGGGQADFSRLKKITGATDGNLGAHLGLLEKAGYIALEKDFVARKPRTRVALTLAGRRAFERHVAALKALLDPVGPQD